MTRGQGRVYQRKGSENWCIEYWVRGRQHRESSHSARKRDAVKLIQKRLGDALAGRPVGPQFEKITFEELAEMLLDDYRVNGRKSLDRAQRSVKHLREFFGGWRALDITPDRVNAYIRFRLDDTPPAKPATIRNETAALGRMFTLAFQAGKVPTRPSFPSIEVRNTRSGFFEDHELRAVLQHLPDAVRAVVSFAYLTGWRVGEILPLTWRHLDFRAGVIRLEPGTTKNDEGRTFPFSASPELEELLVSQRRSTREHERKTKQIIPWVFHRRGRQVRNFHHAWRSACERAGYPGRLVHDLRRTAVREMERAGVSRSVAMKLTGHKTESIYRRYAIVSESDLAEGVSRRAAFRARTRTVPAQSAIMATNARDVPKQ